jgi:hypothetical protein
VHAWSAVEPERRLVHDPTFHALPGEGGQIRLGVRELSPGGHDRRSLLLDTAAGRNGRRETAQSAVEAVSKEQDPRIAR